MIQPLEDGTDPAALDAPGLWSHVPESDRSASYDRLAHGYDTIVGNRLYNWLVWGCPKKAYLNAAAGFLGTHEISPILDFGCGSLVFTADAYRGHEDRLVLFDRSLGMLERGQRRLPGGCFVQGDAFVPPFPEDSLAGAMAWGMLHVFGTHSAFLPELAKLVRPGGKVAISTLTLSGRTIGDRMLHMLHRRGEAASPESAEYVRKNFAEQFALEHAKQCGSMLFLAGTVLDHHVA